MESRRKSTITEGATGVARIDGVRVLGKVISRDGDRLVLLLPLGRGQTECSREDFELLRHPTVEPGEFGLVWSGDTPVVAPVISVSEELATLSIRGRAESFPLSEVQKAPDPKLLDEQPQSGESLL